ncbi:MAK10-like protein, partial [Tanacetum coccineum]
NTLEYISAATHFGGVNDLEFYNREFKQLCVESGIARHLTVAGTSQQNGLAERMNKTLMDKVRCLLMSGLPKTFWAKATCTAAYRIIRSPSTTIDKNTPMKIWLGHPSDYEMLRIFGYVAYPHDKQGTDKSVKELQVEVELQRLNNHTLEEDQTYQEDGDDEDAEDQETNHTPDLIDYQLARDREPRTRPKPLRRDGLSKEEQDLGVNRSSNWAKAVRHTSIQVILALTAYKDYELEQLDVKTAFFHGNLEEVIYMRQPPGYEQGNKAGIGSTNVLALKGCFDMKEHRGKQRDSCTMENWFRDVIRWALQVLLKELPGQDSVVGLVYGTDRGKHVDVTGFVDSDYAKDPDKGWSINGYTFLAQGCVIFPTTFVLKGSFGIFYTSDIITYIIETIKLPVGNNVVPLRSDTIRLVKNGCSLHGLRFEDPNQHLKDFLKIVDSLDLDGENRERTRLRLFQFSLRDQASNWLKRLPAGSITTWENLTTRFLAQFFPPRRTEKLRNDILMFQQHHRESISEAWTRFKDLLQKVPHHAIDLWLQNDPRDFVKPVKAIALPQDVTSTSEHRLIELENQVQCSMEAQLALTQPTQVNKITTSCEICSGPYDTQYCMKDHKQAFAEYASSRNHYLGYRKLTTNQGPGSFNEATNTWKGKPNFNWKRT